MTQEDAGTSAVLRPGDFDALYRGRPDVTFGQQGVSLDVIPWNIQAPQPIVVEVEQAGEIAGPVLDAGCGLGDNAFFLAERGYRITAFDASPAVIEQDQQKARDRGLRVEFVVADATTLEGVDQRFNTVVDSALFHCLDENQQQQYIAALHRVCEPGARLHLLCFSDALPVRFGVVCSSEDSLRRTLSYGWTIHRLQRRSFTTALTRDALRRQFDDGSVQPADVESFDIDDAGRIVMPCWQVMAERI
jgi:SAM-dependent methyltransferase